MKLALFSAVALCVLALSGIIAAAVPIAFKDFDATTQTTKFGLVRIPGQEQLHRRRHALLLQQLARGDAFSASATPDFEVLPWAELVQKNLTDVSVTSRFNASIHQIGWNYLEIDFKITNGSASSDFDQFFFAGAIEGALTCATLLKTRAATLAGLSEISKKESPATKWIVSQIQWMSSMSQQHAASDPYWRRVGTIIDQLAGIVAGCNKALLGIRVFNFFELFVINLDMELSAIEAAAAAANTSSSGETINLFRKKSKLLREYARPQHCSALVKLDENSNKVFASQVVWGPQEVFNLFRVWKKYVNFSRDANAPVLVMSSYPAMTHSADSFYQLSSASSPTKWVVQETTIGNENPKLWKTMAPATTAEFVRSMVSTFSLLEAGGGANTGKEWGEAYGKHNSGTYSNQWMVVTQTKGKKADKFDFSLWVHEQAVTILFSEDATSMLFANKYFGSYNLPMLAGARSILGFDALEKEYGNFFSYTDAPRARIFKRLQHNIVDTMSFASVMRYNNFQFDPDSLIDPSTCKRCPGGVCEPKFSAMLAISSRGDLNPRNNNNNNSSLCYGSLSGYLGFERFGGLDAKLAELGRGSSNTVAAVNGPTDVQQPVFVMPDSDWIPVIPKVYNFSFMKF